MSQKPITPPPSVPNGTGSPLLDQQILLNQQLATLIANTTANFTDLYNGAGGGGGGGNVLRNGTGAPLNSLGIDGDFYIDTTAHNLYGPRAGGVWPSGIAIVGPQGSAGSAGSNGTNGNTVNHGTGVPGSGVGNNGDFYIDTAGNMLYGAKSAGAWGSGTSLVGPAGGSGNTMLTTSGAPSNGTGNNGDYANDPTAQIMYGPKASGSWPAGKSYAGSGGAAGTMRNIATRCRHNYQTWVTSTAYAFKSLTEHINQGSTVNGITVKYGNWYANNVNEFSSWTNSGTLNYYASLEYPNGNFNMFEWSAVQGTPHARFGTATGGSTIESDLLGIGIPHGAKFKIHLIVVSASGTPLAIPVSASTVAGGSDATAYWATSAAMGTNDPWLLNFTGATTGSSGTSGAPNIYPLAIKGVSSVPSVILYGDSRLSGKIDSTTSTAPASENTNLGYWGVGEIARTLDYGLPYANIGCESDTILQFTTNHALRAALASDHQYVHFEYGINDVSAGRTAATIEGQLTTAYGYFPSQRVSQSTIPPKTASSDSWATAVNQTVDGFNSTRTALNDWIRTKPSPLWQYFEIADIMETARNSGIWKNVGDGSATAAMTGDGLHEVPFSYNLIRLSGNINLALFT
jgi:hypothetical protein